MKRDLLWNVKCSAILKEIFPFFAVSFPGGITRTVNMT